MPRAAQQLVNMLDDVEKIVLPWQLHERRVNALKSWQRQ